MRLTAASVLLIAATLASALYAQSSPTGKTAEEAFKNIQALRGTPADQLIPAMQFISTSLGVDCEFCHVEGKFDADDKPAKKTARQMISMTLAINKDSFNSRKEVTCYTCHRGQNDPMGTPPVASEDTKPEHAEAAPQSSGPAPTADQVLDKYLAALGGSDAVRKVSSRVEKGNVSFSGHETAIEIFAKAPNKRVSVMHSPNGDSFTAYDGNAGWLGNTGRPARDMSPQESDAARLDADLYFATHIKEIFSGVRLGRPDKVGDHPVYTVIAFRQGQPPVRLFFDQSSGLLLRMVRYTDTPVGRSPTQIDYADYREVDGVRVPFRWTLARTNGRFTIQLQEVKQNVPVEDEKFVKPPMPPSSGTSQSPSAH